jgi:hypothetical protein
VKTANKNGFVKDIIGLEPLRKERAELTVLLERYLNYSKELRAMIREIDQRILEVKK